MQSGEIKMNICLVFFKKWFYSFCLEKVERGRKWGRATSIRERNINWLPLACTKLGAWPATQAWDLAGNRTSDLSVHRPMFNTLSHSGQGSFLSWMMRIKYSRWRLFENIMVLYKFEFFNKSIIASAFYHKFQTQPQFNKLTPTVKHIIFLKFTRCHLY